MTQGQKVHFVEIENDVKGLGNLVARMEDACVDVTHGITTLTEEIVVMNLFQMILYVNGKEKFRQLAELHICPKCLFKCRAISGIKKWKLSAGL